MTESTSPAQPERRSRRPIAIAIVALLALIGGCASWRIPRYIDDKVGRATTCLRDAKVDYRHLTLTPGLTSISVGGLTSTDKRAEIEKALNACSGLGTVNFASASDSESASQRFEWGADGDSSGITVSGNVRTDDERALVLAGVSKAAGDAKVTDELKVGNVASNAPTLDALVTFLPRLRKLVDPALITVAGNAVNITGSADEANTPKINDVINEMSIAGVLPTVNLSPASSGKVTGMTEAALAVNFDGDTATLTGTAPSEADILAIRSTVGQSFDTWDTSGVKVGSSETGSDSVTGFAAALPDIMAGLSSGRATLIGEDVTIEGTPGADAGSALASAVASLESHKLTATVKTGDATLDALGSGTPTATTEAPATTAAPTTAPATTAPATTAPATTAPATTTTAPLSADNKAISDQLSALVASSPIPFETGSATLGAGATTILDQIATLLKKATGVKIRIEGHTDSQGDPTANQLLSESRANAVFEALAARGVARTVMTAAGLGDTKPIADNATADGRAKNRRVVFVLSQG